MKVKLLRKLRKEARLNIRVKQERDHFTVRYHNDNVWRLHPGPIQFYRKKEDAIAYCDECRRDYILEKIDRFIY